MSLHAPCSEVSRPALAVEAEKHSAPQPEMETSEANDGLSKGTRHRHTTLKIAALSPLDLGDLCAFGLGPTSFDDGLPTTDPAKNNSPPLFLTSGLANCEHDNSDCHSVNSCDGWSSSAETLTAHDARAPRRRARSHEDVMVLQSSLEADGTFTVVEFSENSHLRRRAEYNRAYGHRTMRDQAQ
eukprot:CAMPEP_0196740474 /NCGR_PEP_ID=MMETSP1091-20130531/32644_1 /TAXON_ID=302021 /ORGANISM="Rhodomonas sp., Strain CCMP768" /LENGTH=183 /DNA_ID=CAMNT_0042085659 /DNA_START=50 /DNA_END=601 /DNA_ORIENTATION=+